MDELEGRVDLVGAGTRKLISICSTAICGQPQQLPEGLLRLAGERRDEYAELLRNRNGFYCFESALHVFPSDCSPTMMDVERWNADELWRNEYGEVTQGCLFFAEDAFGGQFGFRNGTVYHFDPESAEMSEFGNSLEDWANKILADCEYTTGYPLAQEWQRRNGPLPRGKRLLPKVPFILGGEYNEDNLYAADAVEGMRFRADIWKQIRNLPDGAEVRLKIVD